MSLSYRLSAIVLILSSLAAEGAWAQPSTPASTLAEQGSQQEAGKPQEQVTGNGGHHLRYSSTQMDVSMTDAQQQAFRLARDYRYADEGVESVLAAIAAELKRQGYIEIAVDREFHLVEARHDETLASRGREILRGVAKTRGVPLPSRPDHQSTEVLIVASAEPAAHDVMVRSRFRTTVWDSNGDSKTTVASEPSVYRDFFAGVGKQLKPAAAATAGR